MDEDIKKLQDMNYSEYVGLVRETNRPSGEIKTVQEVCINAFIAKKSDVLERGFNILNIARLSNRVSSIFFEGYMNNIVNCVFTWLPVYDMHFLYVSSNFLH